MDLTTATPVEIDEAWAPLAAKTFEYFWKSVDTRTEIHKLQRSVEAGGWQAKFEAEKIERLEASLPKLAELREAAELAEAPYKAEWTRRGGWTRAYLVVTKGQGHVHRSTECSTCYPTTQFNWLTFLSGATEQEIVDQAGERACTVCYASAPVELHLDRPTQLFSEDEKRRQVERDERAAKRAKADAEKITVEGYYDHGSRPHTHVFKTVRGATNAIASNLSSLTWYGTTHPMASEWISDVEAVRKALADKGVEYDYDKALTNARKRFERETGRTASY